jgi:hypothetical protein
MTRFPIAPRGFAPSRAFISRIALALVPSLGLGGMLAAQAAPASTAHCFLGTRLLRSVVGGGLGGWVGFVAVKIKLSDWNDANRSGAANRQRVQATLVGAAVGATVGALLPQRCGNEAVPSPGAVRSSLNQPITAEEITRAGLSGTAYDIVYSLRRSWLNTRGIHDGSEVPVPVTAPNGDVVIIPGEPQLVVYLDNMRMGTISELHNIPSAGVLGVRYYTPAEANYRWGTGHTHGAIQVLTVVDQASP